MSTSRDDSPGARQCPACSADSGEPVLAGPDGRCPSCGQPLVINADHVEKDLGQVVGVSDRGLRHHRNEDAFHIAVVPTAAGPGGGRDRLRRGFLGAAPRRGVADGGQDRDEAAGRGRPAGRRPGRGVADGGQRRRPGAGRAGRGRRRAGRHLRVRRGQPGADHDLLARRQPRLLARGRRAGPQRPERHDRHHRRVQADHQRRLAGRGDGRGRPGVHGRRDGVTAGPRDHPLARGRPARPAGAPRAVHPDRARRAAASPPTASGTTARRPPNWPPWRCPPRSSARSTPPPTSSSSPSTRAASTTSRLF